jgi:hypothetical protein
MSRSTRVILVVPLIGLTVCLAYAGIVRGSLMEWEEGGSGLWSGPSATLGGFGWLSLTCCLTLALIYTNQTTKDGWLIIVARICAAVFMVLEGMAASIAHL